MGDESNQSETVIDVLTDEEQMLLSKALKKLEVEVFHKVLKRLSTWIAVVLSIFLIGGLVNLSSLYSNIENSASTKLANDPELRDKIINRAQENLKEVHEKLKGLNERAAEIEKENARASTMFVDDIQQIRLMVEKIGLEITDNFPKSDHDRNTRSENKNNQ